MSRIEVCLFCANRSDRRGFERVIILSTSQRPWEFEPLLARDALGADFRVLVGGEVWTLLVHRFHIVGAFAA